MKTVARSCLHLAVCLIVTAGCSPDHDWSRHELQTIRSLHLAQLPPITDPSNHVVDHPQAIKLGEALFNDQRLSANQAVACASCHQPTFYFADPRPRSVGLGTTQRHSPSLLGVGHSRWFYWDGRRDSLWAQALTPIEHPAEQGLTRQAVADLVQDDADYVAAYKHLFGHAPSDVGVDRLFSNLGKAIAAYVSTLQPGLSRFDTYIQSLDPDATVRHDFTAQEIHGLDLFIGKAQCVSCHNGPLLTNHLFHNIGTGIDSATQEVDQGRLQGVRAVEEDPFNCLGVHSDSGASECALSFAKRDGAELLGAFKVPSLRNVALTPPYMHDARFKSLDELIGHYNTAVVGPGHLEIVPLGLNPEEVSALVAFLATLTQLEVLAAQDNE